jgi:hypothetical protein
MYFIREFSTSINITKWNVIIKSFEMKSNNVFRNKVEMSTIVLTDWSTIGISDCNTLATLNLMLGTLWHATLCSIQVKTNKSNKLSLCKQLIHLSFDALMTIGRSWEQVISDPITGESRETACKMVIRYR